MSSLIAVGNTPGGGAQGYRMLSEPENTLRSIWRAIEIGVDAVEVEVRRSSNGLLVLMHGTTLIRSRRK
jgi:glycerophosphoryl diester phosphodiesterase